MTKGIWELLLQYVERVELCLSHDALKDVAYIDSSVFHKK